MQIRWRARDLDHLPPPVVVGAVLVAPCAAVNSLVADMMALTGMSYVDARELIPSME